MPQDTTRTSFTDIFIKHPVSAIVVNVMILLGGWRAMTAPPVRQYPTIENSQMVTTTIYYGAGAETIRGFLSTPIERVVSAIGGVDYVESTSRAQQHRHSPGHRHNGGNAVDPLHRAGVSYDDRAPTSTA